MKKKHSNNTVFDFYHTRIKNHLQKNIYASIPRKHGENIFYTNKSGIEGLSLFIKRKRRTVTIHEANKTDLTLRHWSPSPRGTYIAYELVPTHSESGTLYVYDCNKYETIAQLPYARHSQIIWTEDETQVLYIGAEPEENNSFIKRVYRYDTKQRKFDGAIHTIGSMRLYSSVFKQSNNRKYIYLTCTEFASKNMEVWNYTDNFTKITGNIPSMPFLINNNGKVFAIIKDPSHPNGYIVQSKIELSLELSQIVKNAKVFISKLPELCIIEGGIFSDKHILIKGSWNGSSMLFLYKTDGTFVRKLDLPDICSVRTIINDFDSETFTFRISFYHQPDEIWQYDCVYNKYKRPHSNNTDYEATKQELTSEGEIVSYIVIRKKNSKISPSPAIITAYGAFGHIRRPGYITPILPWLDQGYLYVIAHVRGGGERGILWDNQGNRSNLVNRLSDLNSITKDLIKIGYTNSQQLGLWGVSAGGWLMLATALKYPQIAKSICVFAPVTNILAFNKYGFGESWKRDFGDPENKIQRQLLRKISPQHMPLPDKIPYIKIVFGNKDERVDSKKHSLTLYNRIHKTFPNQTSIVELDGVGHTIHKNTFKSDLYAHILSFFNKTLT